MIDKDELHELLEGSITKEIIEGHGPIPPGTLARSSKDVAITLKHVSKDVDHAKQRLSSYMGQNKGMTPHDIRRLKAAHDLLDESVPVVEVEHSYDPVVNRLLGALDAPGSNTATDVEDAGYRLGRIYPGSSLHSAGKDKAGNPTWDVHHNGSRVGSLHHTSEGGWFGKHHGDKKQWSDRESAHKAASDVLYHHKSLLKKTSS